MADKRKQANGSSVDDAEFEKLLDEMDELGRQADVLRAKVNHLIDEMRENDVVAEEDGNPEDRAEEDGEREAVDDSENQRPEDPQATGTTP